MNSFRMKFSNTEQNCQVASPYIRSSSVVETNNIFIPRPGYNPNGYPYFTDNNFAQMNSNCRHSLQKHMSMNKSSDELYERIKSPAINSNIDDNHPNMSMGQIQSRERENMFHENNDDKCDAAEAITRFDQEVSCDSDPESYLHSNSDLEETKNNSAASIDLNNDNST